MELGSRNFRRSASTRVERTLFLGISFLLTLVGFEFPADGLENFWYAIDFLGVPASYVVFLLMAGLVTAAMSNSPPLLLPSRLAQTGLWNWAILVCLVIFISVSRGLWDGVADLFADWRNIAVTGLVAVIGARFLSTRTWRGEAILDLAILYGLASWIHLAQFAAGGGTTLLGVRIPLYYGPVLYLAGFAAIVSFDFWSSGALRGFKKFVVFLAGAGATGLVVFAFRRTYWLILAIGFIAILYRHMRDRTVSRSRIYATVGGLVVVVAIAFAVLGVEAVGGRLASFLPGSTSRYSATNNDHLNDIADAWTVVQENWIEGFGIGKFYETPSLVGWKSNSFEVHNALIHVWLKFGLAGVIVYLGFHYRWFKASISNGIFDPVARRGLTAAGTFLVAGFVAALFGTWPYGYFQQSVHHGLLLAALFALSAPSPARVIFPARTLEAASQAP